MIYKGSCHSGLSGISLVVVFLLVIFTISGCSSSSETSPQSKYSIEINPVVVRDRMIPLDRLIMRSMIIVGFKIASKTDNNSDMTIRGELYNKNKLLSEDMIVKPDSLSNNLGFDIPLSEGPFSYEQPMSISDGKYRIVIKLLDAKNHTITETEKELGRNQIGRTFYGFDKVYNSPQYLLINNEKTVGGWRLKATDQKTDGGSLRSRLEATDQKDAKGQRMEAKDQKAEKGYVIFKKSYLERAYPNTEPEDYELITEISTEISKNEYKPLTFSIRAMKDMGKVRISVPTLKDTRGKVVDIAINIGAVNQLTEVVREDSKKNIVYYQYAPKIIEDKEVIIPQYHTQTYWMTIKANSETKPGDYYGSIKIIPQLGKLTGIPFHVTVLPIKLTDTDKQYGMMMDYAFYEMDNETWTEKEKNTIQKRGIEIYRDLRDHGMTVIYPHSYYYYKTDKNGDPILTSLKASLESYKNLQFPGPFVWYLGHLLQTAKPMHPGSILNYDPEVAKRRLTDLLMRFEIMARDLGIPKEKLIVQLVDEPDPDQKERTKAGRELHEVAKILGFRTLITRPWTDVDVICTGIPDNEKQALQLRNMAKEWWIYPNSALTGQNLSFTRYVFGFGAWRWGVDGVVPWTYQMSQGSNGNPFTVLDGSEIMVAYPGVNGPIAAPTWEVLREGINDYKYIYLLEKLISAEKYRKNPVAYSIDGKLRQFKQNLGKGPGPGETDYRDWPPESFDKRRKQIIAWLMELSKTPLKDCCA